MELLLSENKITNFFAMINEDGFFKNNKAKNLKKKILLMKSIIGIGMI